MKENEKKRMAKIKISIDLLHQVLHLPHNTEIVAIDAPSIDIVRGFFTIVLEGEGCPHKVAMGDEIPTCLLEQETKII